MTKSINISNYRISNSDKLTVIAGLNILESEEQTLEVAAELKKIVSKTDNPFIFKASFDKANRSSVDSYRGMGIDKGITIFKALKSEGYNLITDIHEINQVDKIAEVADVIQIPAFLCRQTDLIKAACETNKPLNIKKGQFLSPEQMGNIINKCSHFGNEQIMLCERGTSFGYNNLIVDMLGMSKLKDFGNPVIFDVTHSLQLPGGAGISADGRSVQALDLALSGVAIGLAGIFIEVHPEPSQAKCDGPSATKLDELEAFLSKVNAVDDVVKSF
jgi:2-dehydro-3-deoxyphosphooctonate aldolase (KDO 8-P synthase)|tara:strand:- start:28 stop:849 length:822 start_codon:yes stop_codon:yes gene_type:complete